MKTPKKEESKPKHQGEQGSVNRFLELVGKKTDSPGTVQPDQQRSDNGTASPDAQPSTESGVVDTLMDILHGEYTVDKLLSTLHGLVPIVDHIKQSIETSSVTIPSASTQLSSVTQATETATVTILNNLETLTAALANAEGTLANVRAQSQRNHIVDEEFSRALNTLAAQRGDDAGLANLVALWRQREGEPKILSHVEAIRQCLSGARDTSMQITIALQVQDITSQQIAGVLHLIEEVRLRLTRTLYQVERQIEQVQNSNSPGKPIEGSFDMNASYSMSSDRQTSADEIVQQWTAQQMKK